MGLVKKVELICECFTRRLMCWLEMCCVGDNVYEWVGWRIGWVGNGYVSVCI